MLQGNPGHRPLSGPTATFILGLPTKPIDLDADASQEWDRLTSSLAGVLSPADFGMLLVAVDSYSQLMTATRALRAKGLTYEAKGEFGTMIRTRPECRLRDSARASYHWALSELGASPTRHGHVKRLPTAESVKPTGLRALLDGGTGRFFTS
jgi:P27 family predicted phage terminase small subunit